jgi:hypothetical protein
LDRSRRVVDHLFEDIRAEGEMTDPRDELFKVIAYLAQVLRERADELDYLLIAEFERRAGVEFTLPDPEPCDLTYDDLNRINQLREAVERIAK